MTAVRSDGGAPASAAGAARLGAMGFAEFAEWLEDAEARYPVASWTAAGIHVWPLVRLSLYHENFNRPASPDASRRHPVVDVVRQLGTLATSKLRDRAAEQSPTQSADAVFLAYAIGTQPMLDGRHVNSLLAPYVHLLERLGRRSSVWEASPHGDFHIPRATPSAYIQGHLWAQRLIARATEHRRPSAHLEHYDAFRAHVAASGLRMVAGRPDALARYAHYVRTLATHFRRWLGRATPSLGFIADYGLPEHAFCLACAEWGIPSIELQHGVQGPFHPAYANWSNVPTGGYPVRPTRYWCWSEDDARYIRRWADTVHGEGAVVVGGDPWLTSWGSDSAWGRVADRQIRESEGAGATGAAVLCSLSVGSEILPAALREALAAAPRDWSWWFRLHPVRQQERRAELLAHHAELVGSPRRLDLASSLPLPVLLRHVACQIAVGPSTVIQQAAAFGVPTVVCGPGASEAPTVFPTEAGRGLLRVAETGAEVLQAVAELSADGGQRRGPPASTDGLTAMRTLLETGTIRGTT